MKPQQAIDSRERMQRLRASALSVTAAGQSPWHLIHSAMVVEGRLDDRHAELLGPHFACPAPRPKWSELPDATIDLVDMSQPVPMLPSAPAIRRRTSQAAAPDSLENAGLVLPCDQSAMKLGSVAILPIPPLPAAGADLPALFPASPACCKLRDALLGKVPPAPCTIAFLSQDSSSVGTHQLLELGMSLATASNGEVLLVDANFSSPALSRLFRLDDASGLCEALLGKTPWSHAITATAIARVKLLPSGIVQEHSRTLEPAHWESAAKLWKEQFAYVLIDAGPKEQHIGPLCRACDATFLSLSLRDNRPAIFETLAHLEQQDVPLTGCVLYDVD